MPRKRTSDGKAGPAVGPSEPPPGGRPNGARKSPARSSPVADGRGTDARGADAGGADGSGADGSGATPASAALAARKGTSWVKKTARARPAQAKSNSPQPPPDNDGFREAVTRLAYHFWEARASQDGSPDEDWRRAENAVREVLAKVSSSAAPLAGAEIAAAHRKAREN